MSRPRYEITPEIIHLIADVSMLLGQTSMIHMERPSPKLRKKLRIHSIKASLEIEGNTLNEDQITAITEGKRVRGTQQEILEVKNALSAYASLPDFKSESMKSFLGAHKIMMNKLIEKPGKLRSRGVGIARGDEVIHVAPPAKHLRQLMKVLFDYIAHDPEHPLIKSSVVHYELSFIHPFLDGNGRMSRLWQTRMLLDHYPIFELLPFETIIRDRQMEYYQVLAKCDRAGNSTQFIRFMLDAIKEVATALLDSGQPPKLTAEERMEHYVTSQARKLTFSRRDYMKVFREISTATASRDLRLGVETGTIKKKGDKRLTTYRIP